MNGRLLRAREVAERLGLHVDTVLAWRREGILPGYRVSSGAIRFDEAELDAWLAERATGAANRGVSTAQAGRAHDQRYADRQDPPSSTALPLDAAPTEEDDPDATR